MKKYSEAIFQFYGKIMIMDICQMKMPLFFRLLKKKSLSQKIKNAHYFLLKIILFALVKIFKLAMIVNRMKQVLRNFHKIIFMNLAMQELI